MHGENSRKRFPFCSAQQEVAHLLALIFRKVDDPMDFVNCKHEKYVCIYFLFLLNVNSQLCARGLDEGRSACSVSIYFVANLQFAKVRFLLFKFLPLFFHITLVALSWVNWFGVLNNNNNDLNSTPLWMATIRNCVDLGVYGLFLETKALVEYTNNRYQISDQ